MTALPKYGMTPALKNRYLGPHSACAGNAFNRRWLGNLNADVNSETHAISPAMKILF